LKWFLFGKTKHGFKGSAGESQRDLSGQPVISHSWNISRHKKLWKWISSRAFILSSMFCMEIDWTVPRFNTRCLRILGRNIFMNFMCVAKDLKGGDSDIWRYSHMKVRIKLNFLTRR
jgi:hypothetical protein